MKRTPLLGIVAATAFVIGLSACASSSPSPSGSSTAVIAPVTMSAGELQGASVELVVGQVLNIDTGDLAVDSYAGEVSDSAIAEFVPGREDGSATFNPGVRALAAGTTEVEMANDQGGIEPLRFTVEVSAG